MESDTVYGVAVVALVWRLSGVFMEKIMVNLITRMVSVKIVWSQYGE